MGRDLRTQRAQVPFISGGRGRDKALGRFVENGCFDSKGVDKNLGG